MSLVGKTALQGELCAGQMSVFQTTTEIRGGGKHVGESVSVVTLFAMMVVQSVIHNEQNVERAAF